MGSLLRACPEPGGEKKAELASCVQGRIPQIPLSLLSTMSQAAPRPPAPSRAVGPALCISSSPYNYSSHTLAPGPPTKLQLILHSSWINAIDPKQGGQIQTDPLRNKRPRAKPSRENSPPKLSMLHACTYMHMHAHAHVCLVRHMDMCTKCTGTHIAILM